MAKGDKKNDKDEKDEREEKDSAHEGAEGEDSTEDLGEGGKKKLGKKKLIILAVVGVLVLAAVAGGALYFTGAFGKKEASTEQREVSTKDKPVFFPLGDILVNLNGEGKRPNFLKIKVSLELADEKDVPLMEALKPRIIDNFQVYLRELRIEDLRGSAGLYRLREELLLRVTEAAQPIRVRDVLFQEMLVQ